MVFENLSQGAENALSTADLVKLTGVKSARELQAMIARERADGCLILSSNRGGYFRPSDGEKGQLEIVAFCRTLLARALNTIKALKTAREALESVDGQTQIDDL
jgi:hypothetical protein